MVGRGVVLTVVAGLLISACLIEGPAPTEAVGRIDGTIDGVVWKSTGIYAQGYGGPGDTLATSVGCTSSDDPPVPNRTYMAIGFDLTAVPGTYTLSADTSPGFSVTGKLVEATGGGASVSGEIVLVTAKPHWTGTFHGVLVHGEVIESGVFEFTYPGH